MAIPKSVTAKMESEKERKRLDELCKSIEKECNVPLFFFYCALIYSFDLYNQLSVTYGKNEQKSSRISGLFSDIEKTRNNLSLALQNILGAAGSKEKQNIIGNVLDAVFAQCVSVIEANRESIYNVIADRVLDKNKKYKDDDKAVMQVTLLSKIVTFRRLLVMSKHSIVKALDKYKDCYPILTDIMPLADVKSAISVLDDFVLNNKSIKNIDFSLDAECAEGQRRIIAKVCSIVICV